MRILKKTNYQKFIGALTKKGNKTAATNILKKTFKIIGKVRHSRASLILPKILLKLQSSVEIKRVPWGGGRKKRYNLIPFSVKKRRQKFLRIKWILEGLKADKRQVDFSKKLSAELWNLLYLTKKSNAIRKKKQMRQEIITNRSNSHYRW